MTSPSRTAQQYDIAIIAGTAISLYWSLYVQPLNGELLAFALGCVPVALGLYRYVAPDAYLVEGLVGLLAVVLGGMTPPSILTNTRAGDWLVGGSPLPLSLGLAIAVVLGVMVVRRVLQGGIAPATDAAA